MKGLYKKLGSLKVAKAEEQKATKETPQLHLPDGKGI